jgi:hypothetical protein
LFLCDLGKMDLIENDRYLEMILTGRVWWQFARRTGLGFAVASSSENRDNLTVCRVGMKFSVFMALF